MHREQTVSIGAEVAGRAPAEDEVEVAVAAVGLNFRDLMAVSDVLPAEAESRPPSRRWGWRCLVSCAASAECDGTLPPATACSAWGAARCAVRSSLPRWRWHARPLGCRTVEAATIPSAYHDRPLCAQSRWRGCDPGDRSDP